MRKLTLLASAILTIGASTFAAPQQGQTQPTQQIANTIQTKQQANLNGEVRGLIEQVKKAPPSEKYIYMNQLKQKLRELSSQERKEVMHEVVKELKGGKEEAIEHVSGKNERAEREVSEKHNMMKGENREHANERGNMEMEKGMEMNKANEMNGMQERMMERAHEVEEKRTDIQERTQFRHNEERRMESHQQRGNMERYNGRMNGENGMGSKYNNEMRQGGMERNGQ